MKNFDPLNQAPDIRVCGVDELDAEIACQPRSIISIWDPKSEDMQRHLENIKRRLPAPKVCVARFDDIASETPGRHLMKSEDMEEILRFSRTAPSPILIHCRAGISRSTAVAYAILCQARGPGHELECMVELTRIRPQAVPNEYIVGLADTALRREGAMLRAYRSHMQKYIIGGGHEGEP